MPSYSYKALSVDGQGLAGECDAADRLQALRELASRGLNVIHITEGRSDHSAQAKTSRKRLRLRPKQVAFLTRQLATSIGAGLPLMTALNVIGQELEHAASRSLLNDLREEVQQGSSLSDALARHPEVFPSMYVRLVQVGETGGVLDTVLMQLAEMLERQTEMRERIKSASIYPAIVFLLGVVSVAVIVTYIVPRIISAIGTDVVLLPLPTRMLMYISDVVGSYWWLFLLAAAGAGISWRQIVLRGAGRPLWDRLRLKIPILGRLIRQIEAARFARSLGTLTQSGVAITEALPVVRDTIQNDTMRRAVNGVIEGIKAGESIASPLQRTSLFPPLLVQMVRVGENTGRLDEMLLRSAQVHESEARVTLERFVSVLPVAMILAMALVVGFIVAGLVLAIVEFQTLGGAGLTS